MDSDYEIDSLKVLILFIKQIDLYKTSKNLKQSFKLVLKCYV